MYVCPKCGLRDQSIGANVCPNCERSYRELKNEAEERFADQKQEAELVNESRLEIPPCLFRVLWNEGSRDLASLFVEASSTKQARRRARRWCIQQKQPMLDPSGNDICFLSGPDRETRLNQSVIAEKITSSTTVTSYVTASESDPNHMFEVSIRPNARTK